ncbi:MAG: C4-dicarboxylate ABC transporter substrate-binding protein [Rhizobiales bacterium NRL2]|jgi:TRAP-type C4-dicarboxylate transport system substrate-binding protein|nr:MAG: C4-dicarboxylate ABC transporter substrate-binding protein [Rhizobiales bacterium NRL2]
MLHRTLTGLAVAAATTFAFAGAAWSADDMVDGPAVTWNHSLWGKPRAFTMGLEHLSDELARRTGGKFEYNLNYGGLSKPKENLDGIEIGAFEAANFCNFYSPDRTPSAMIFSLPFLPIGDWEVRIKASDAYYQHPAVKKEMAGMNAMIYMAGVLPQYEFLGRGEPPRKLEDWNGKKVRAGGGVADAMSKLGATLMTVPATEVYTLLERGTVDAVSFPYSYAHAAYKVHEVADWFTGNFQPGTADCPTVFNIDAWNALPKQYQDLLMELKWEVYEKQKAAYLAADEVNIPMFQKQLTEVRFTEDELAEFRKQIGVPIWQESFVDRYADRLPTQELLDFLLAEAEKVRGGS